MSSPRRIDLVSPPFAGHLFPALGMLERVISDDRFALTCLTTASGLPAARRAGVTAVELLRGADQAVLDLANQPSRVGSNPLRMLGQFTDQLRLMERLLIELEERWRSLRPDLVIVDFAVPFAGLLARRMGLRWWTSMSAPSAFETDRGPPTYLGGWLPHEHPLFALRDWLGRRFVSTFKRSVAFAFRRALGRLGVPPRVYRADGTEVLYSPERVLMLGMRELEFDRGWPAHVEFLGPVWLDPGIAGCEPEFVPERRHCLISLGTHVPWAKRKAVALFQQVADRMENWTFDFSWGEPTRMKLTGVVIGVSFRSCPTNDSCPVMTSSFITPESAFPMPRFRPAFPPWSGPRISTSLIMRLACATTNSPGGAHAPLRPLLGGSPSGSNQPGPAASTG